MSRRLRSTIATPLIWLAFVALRCYERFVEGDHYQETLK